jgi:hypothetical protein
MKVSFRQGIISYPVFGNVQQFLKPNGNYVDLNTDNGDVQVTFAHKQSNYHHIETDTISQAWGPFLSNNNHWLYWDINLQTGQRDFGYTLIPPVVNYTQPIPPVNDMHWYDLSNNVMKVYIGGGFREKVRVFAAIYNGVTFTPLGQGILKLPFGGTQVGLNVNNFTGRIILDDSGKPIKRSTGEFFTTESQFFTSGSLINAVRLESNTITAEYATNIAAFQVVSYINDGIVKTSIYEDVGATVIGLALEDGVVGDVRSILLQGIATNTNWNWQTIGIPLWVDNGVLVESDPHTVASTLHPAGTVPVARVLSRKSIIFEQGLGGRGDRGPTGSIENISEATPTELGGVAISVTPSIAAFPIAVGTNDPRMSDARIPLTPHPDSVSKTGSTMTGVLTLNGNPTSALHAATKQYVDSFAEYDIKCQANGVLGTSVPLLITHVVASRSFIINSTGHAGYVITAATGSNVIFTVSVNGVNKGTALFSTGINSIVFTLTQTTIAVGDSITVRLTTADSNNIFANVALNIKGRFV